MTILLLTLITQSPVTFQQGPNMTPDPVSTSEQVIGVLLFIMGMVLAIRHTKRQKK